MRFTKKYYKKTKGFKLIFSILCYEFYLGKKTVSLSVTELGNALDAILNPNSNVLLEIGFFLL